MTVLPKALETLVKDLTVKGWIEQLRKLKNIKGKIT